MLTGEGGLIILFLMIRTAKEWIKLPLDQVYDITSHPDKAHYVRIKTAGKSYDVLDSLSRLEKEYSPVLVRCHRNCLVNLSKIREIDVEKRVLILEGNRPIAFSRRRYQELRQLWLNKGEEIR
ncbi:TPA: LytTR family transcriptional regulator DNA-binding domain-containing protein [Streptococcus suis]|nr:LytTR family transcriptional regulator [Streptococcus suis]HEM4291313.1 LytTR family transcriptional regulator DNA-binding domain-containing protein [Streptococcus suis]